MITNQRSGNQKLKLESWLAKGIGRRKKKNRNKEEFKDINGEIDR